MLCMFDVGAPDVRKSHRKPYKPLSVPGKISPASFKYCTKRKKEWQRLRSVWGAFLTNKSLIILNLLETSVNCFSCTTTEQDSGSCRMTSSHLLSAVWNWASLISVQDSSLLDFTICCHDVTATPWGRGFLAGSWVSGLKLAWKTWGGKGLLKVIGRLENESTKLLRPMTCFQHPTSHGSSTGLEAGSSLQALANWRSERFMQLNCQWKRSRLSSRHWPAHHPAQALQRVTGDWCRS